MTARNVKAENILLVNDRKHMKKLILILFVVLIGIVFAVPGKSIAQEAYTIPSGTAIDEKTAANFQSQLSAMKAMLLALQKEYAAKQAGNVSLPTTLLNPQEATALNNGLTALSDVLTKLRVYVASKELSDVERSAFTENLTRIVQNLTSLNNAIAQPNLAIARENIKNAEVSSAATKTEVESKPFAQQQERNISEKNAPVLESSAPPSDKNQATASIAPLATKRVLLSLLVAIGAAALGFWLWKQWSRKKKILPAGYTDYSERKSAV